jgi:mRNA interferase YafQ
MRTTIRRLNSFKRDWKREAKGKSPEYVQKLDAELAAAVKMLVADITLPPRYADHPLSGTWKGYWDCHLRPDLVMIYGKPTRALLSWCA